MSDTNLTGVLGILAHYKQLWSDNQGGKAPIIGFHDLMVFFHFLVSDNLFPRNTPRKERLQLAYL